jgi:glycosidase
MEREFGNYGIYKNLYLYNFVDNHDVNRIASTLKDKALLNNVHTLLFTMPGAPSIYYGSEFGIEGQRTKHCDYDLRPCLNLNEIPNPNYELLSHIKKLSKIRHTLSALKNGSYKNENIQLEHLCYSMKNNEQKVFVL